MIYEAKCPCSLLNNKSKKCRLIKGNVIDVIHCAEGENHFMSRSEILQTAYILVPDEKFTFNKGQNIIVSAYSSPNKKYLIYSRTRNKDKNMNYVYRGNLIQSPGECYKFSLLKWLELSKIQPSEKNIKTDKFAEFILTL